LLNFFSVIVSRRSEGGREEGREGGRERERERERERRKRVEMNESAGAKRRGARWPFSRHPVSVNYQAALPSVAWRFN